jgi:two-component system, NtrC family, sensor kinase
MKRRSRAGSVKPRRRKAAAPKRTGGTEAARPRSSSAASQKSQIARLTGERDEVLEQQRATAEVLKTISASPAELQPLLEVIVRSAARFCEADDVTILQLDGQILRIVAHCGAVPQEIGFSFLCTRGSVAGRTVLDRKPIHIVDLQVETEEFPEGSAFARQFGHRTTAHAPLLREGRAIGTLMLRRSEVNPFTDKQLALLETFAAQAVIAIENARLLNELRQRTEEVGKLNQHLEQRVTDQVDEIERMGRLRRFLPPQVADLIVASVSTRGYGRGAARQARGATVKGDQ